MQKKYDGIDEMFANIEDPLERARLMKNERTRRWKLENKDKVRAARKRHVKKYSEKIKKEAKKYREEHPEYKKEWYKQHKVEAKEWWNNRSKEQKQAKAEYNKVWKKARYKNNNNYKIRCIISSAVRRSLKGMKKGDSIKNILGYTIEELKEHLEHQFEDWMNWDNLGLTANKEKETWQIDHIIPVNTFNIKEIGDEEFRKCWALDNLRPLDSYINNRRPKDGSDIKGIE